MIPRKAKQQPPAKRSGKSDHTNNEERTSKTGAKNTKAKSDNTGGKPKEKKDIYYLTPEQTADSLAFLVSLETVLLTGLSKRQKDKIHSSKTQLNGEEMKKLLYLVRDLNVEEESEMHSTINKLNSTPGGKSSEKKLNNWFKTWKPNSVPRDRLEIQKRQCGPGTRQRANNLKSLGLLYKLRSQIESHAFENDAFFLSLDAKSQEKVLENIDPPRFKWKPRLPPGLPLECKSAIFSFYLGCSGGVRDKNLDSGFSVILKYFGCATRTLQCHHWKRRVPFSSQEAMHEKHSD
jgi:hypothetical protein